MAGQDFAQVKAPKKPESSGGSGSLFVVFGIVFVAVTCFAAGFWLGGNQGGQQETSHPELDAAQAQMKEQEAQLKLQQARIEALEEDVVQWKKKADQDATTRVGELEFYHDLPRQSVTPAPVSDSPGPRIAARPVLPPHPGKPSIKKRTGARTDDMPATDRAVKKSAPNRSAADATAKTVGVYRIQIASSKVEAEAIRFQKKLFNAGFSAFIRSVDLGEKGIWYRIYVGPFSSKAAAEKAQIDLHKLTKTKGFLVRGR